MSGKLVRSRTFTLVCGWAPGAATTPATTSTPRSSSIAASRRPHLPSPRGGRAEITGAPVSPPGLRLLGSEPFDAPAALRLRRVADAVVQTVFAVLPELDRLRDDAIPAPVRW